MNRWRVITAGLAGGVAVLLSVAGVAQAGAAGSQTAVGVTQAGGISTAATTCRGEPAQVADGDVWMGTVNRDVVVAVAGTVNQVLTLGGDDLICVYGPRQAQELVVSAGPGNDTVITYSGNSSVYGDDGDDILYLNGSGDYAVGGAGNDDLWGLGVDGIFIGDGGTGNDMVQGSLGNDLLSGGGGDDLIIGADGVDVINGGSGNDRLQGGEGGSDNLDGGADTDTCTDDSTTVFANCESIVLSPPFGLKG
jgi:Ca2+-binding RTX toxin-like protein